SKILWLLISLVTNLGMLGTFKYFNFFADNVASVATMLGLSMDPIVLNVVLPVGISFYTFQTLSYTIDIYRGLLKPRRSFIDFALFVAFFPQLVAGPIERATRFLPQVERRRRFRLVLVTDAIPLLVRGYFKKLVVADNVAVYVNQIYGLESPSLLLLSVGSVGFAIQILADFSAYTDIARGSARLLGFDLIKNFNRPYVAITPSDFWRRWHISFSTWIRDYVYIPLGGSRVKTLTASVAVLIATMAISGLWHGAAWHFVAWGIYHGILLAAYRLVGFGSRWTPSSLTGHATAVGVMFTFTIFGWSLFRTDELPWLMNVLASGRIVGTNAELLGATVVGILYALYCGLWLADDALTTFTPNWRFANVLVKYAMVAAVLLFGAEEQIEFIYFQF
ncbi:MBOAT family protein, partial [Rubripirellula sp.]|nr:MBOAT family protein [Rubripirellula sp.]